MRAAGVKKEFTCTAQTGILERKMLFALCSDGVYKCMEPEALKEALKLAIKGDGLARPLADMEMRCMRTRLRIICPASW